MPQSADSLAFVALERLRLATTPTKRTAICPILPAFSTSSTAFYSGNFKTLSQFEPIFSSKCQRSTHRACSIAAETARNVSP